MIRSKLTSLMSTEKAKARATSVVPSLPFPRIEYCDAIKMIQDIGEDLEMILIHHCDIIAEKYPDFRFLLPQWR